MNEEKKSHKQNSKKKKANLKLSKGESSQTFIMNEKNNNILKPITPPKYKVPNEIRKYEYIYSPRTTFNKRKQYENKLFHELAIGFDPITIKILKSHFKERLGVLDKIDFIGILKNHLLGWHPEIEDRETILIKLLNRLFWEIDLNDNGDMEWNEFTNFIINNSDNEIGNKISYSLKSYNLAKNDQIKIDSTYNSEISYSFYIEKLNIIGIVIEGKSVINFYDANNGKKLKTSIDVKETQREIDELEIIELDLKAKKILNKEKEEKLLKKLQQEEMEKKVRMELKGNTYELFKNSNIDPKNFHPVLKPSRESILIQNFQPLKDKAKKQKDYKDKLKARYLHLTKGTDDTDLTKKVFNKKLTILTTEFIPEYDTLLVSSSNNKISAWKYIENEFKNVNSIDNAFIDKNSFKCALLSTNIPQYTLSWDPMQKFLYSGQADGKILKWDLTKSKNLENDTLVYQTAKEKLNRRGYNNYSSSENKLNTSQIQTDRHATINANQNEITNEEDLKGEKLLNKLKSESMKRDTVSCIVILGKLQLLAAGYYNGNIILWDTMLKDFRKFYTDQETGIYQLVYNSNKNLLFSCGFDHSIFIYDPYIDNSAVYKLNGHNWSINSIAVNNIDDELISLDILGNIKIWDLNNFYNFQTINLNELESTDKKLNHDINNSKKKKISSNLKMIFLSKPKKILTYGNKLMLFETDTSNNPDLVDDTLVLGTYYNSNFYEFICVCLKKIKIFSALTGKITKIYENIMQGEIMTYDKDKSLKRIYIGDNYGKIKNYNMNNGLLIKEYMSHNAEVLSLVHATCTDQLISLGNDKLIRIFSDKDVNDTLLLKEIELNQMPVIKIAVNEDFERLIMGLENKRIRFFDLHHFRLDSEVNLKKPLNRNDIVCCIFCIPRYELCLISCLSGKNYFMVTPPNNLKYHIFGEFNQIDEKEVEIISAITSININFENKELYVGDQNGFLTCYDLHELYEILDKYKKITIECLNELDKYNITKKYSYQIHKETINKIDFPIIDPNIIITTSTDRKVKLLNLEGKVIDDLKQINNKFPEVPIGIKYFIADPFLSKKNYDEITETGVIYRDEIEKKNFNLKNSIMRIRQEHPIINSYSKLITELNAKERLYLITKNSKIGNNKSNNFNFNINIELIENIENNDFKKLFDEIKKKNENLQLSSKNLQSIQIFSDNYNPTFLNDFNEEKISEFSNTLNQKMRNIKLATSKLKLEKSKYEVFEKENKRSSVINLKEVMKSLNLKTNEHKKKFDDKFKLKRREMFGLNKKNLHSTNDMFISFQEDVKKELNNLNLQLEENIKKKYLEPIREFNSTYQGKNIKGKKILPKINNNKISINKNKTVTNKIEINSEDNKNNNNNQQ